MVRCSREGLGCAAVGEDGGVGGRTGLEAIDVDEFAFLFVVFRNDRRDAAASLVPSVWLCGTRLKIRYLAMSMLCHCGVCSWGKDEVFRKELGLWIRSGLSKKGLKSKWAELLSASEKHLHVRGETQRHQAWRSKEVNAETLTPTQKKNQSNKRRNKMDVLIILTSISGGAILIILMSISGGASPKARKR